MLETSLGYYINPLISVLIGVAFLSEKLTRPQIAAVVLAAIGVIIMTIDFGEVPWISLFLAVTFAIYGYLRKITNVDPLEGLSIEVIILLPFAIGYLAFMESGEGTTLMHEGSWTVFLLILAGPMTVIPLFLFNYGAQRIRLATLGLMQYLAPTVQLVIAVWMYGETLTDTHLVTFGLIWAGLALFSWDTWWRERELRRVARAALPIPKSESLICLPDGLSLLQGLARASPLHWGSITHVGYPTHRTICSSRHIRRDCDDRSQWRFSNETICTHLSIKTSGKTPVAQNRCPG